MRQHQPIDGTAIRCTECNYEVTSSPRWRRAGGTGRMAPHCCPTARSALDESSHPTLPRARECLSFCVAAPAARILDVTQPRSRAPYRLVTRLATTSSRPRSHTPAWSASPSWNASVTFQYGPQGRAARARSAALRVSWHRAPANASLTRRELEVLRLLAGAMRPKEIARELVISPKTVANHIQRVLGKLGAHSSAEAVAIAYREGFGNSAEGFDKSRTLSLTGGD